MEIERILRMSKQRGASDLHYISGLAPALRVDGELTRMQDEPVIKAEDSKRILYEFLTDEQIHYLEKHRAIDTAIYFPELGNFRVNVFHQLNGLSAVFRVVVEKIPTFEELNVPPIMKRLLMMPHGLILVTGPTGSGKSSTLASMIDYINSNKPCHIITIEDPIEYIHTSKKATVNQLQIGRDTTSFAAALRSSLRQDPDIIMLGEMRDLESIRLALTAAETGHLVLSTLHASTAAITISRIVDIFPLAERARVRNILSETIQGVLCQTLVKKAKSGRTAAFEVMLATPAVRHLISQGMNSHLESTIQTGGDLGMFTMETSLKELVARGLVSKSTAAATLASRDSMKFAEGVKKETLSTPTAPPPKSMPT
jgi:twitching motility protein PilT